VIKNTAVGYEFFGNYLAKWTHYKAMLSAELSNDRAHISFVTNYYGRISVDLANNDDLELHSNYHVARDLKCREKPKECVKRLGEIKETISQARARPVNELSESQTEGLQCLEGVTNLLGKAVLPAEEILP
jgi:hypothetical protein